MPTNFPDDVDSWANPEDANPLSTSPDGRDHQQHHADLQTVALAMENQLVGPVFRSVDSVTTTSDLVLPGGGDCESTTGWVTVGTNTPSTVTSPTTQGTRAVKIGGWKISSDNNPALTTVGYLELTSGPVARGGRGFLALDIRWSSTEFNEDTLGAYFELVVSDALALGGNTVTYPLPTLAENTWGTAKAPITELDEIRSVGIRPFRHFDKPDSFNLSIQFTIDNIRFPADTKLEHALGGGPTLGAVVVPPDYEDVSQGIIPVGGSQALLDLRPDRIRVRGERDVRDFQIPLDGTTDITTQMNTIFGSLRKGDKLVFPRGYRFYFTGPMVLRNLEQVEIDFNGCKFWTDLVVTNGHVFTINECRDVTVGNVRIYGYNPRSDLGSEMVTYGGTPVLPGDGSVTLDGQGDAVYLPNPRNHGLTPDDDIKFDITVRQSSASATNDLKFSMFDANSPTTAPTAASAGYTDGPLAPGTYHYCVTYLDLDGFETTAGPRGSVTLATGGEVTLTNIPVPTAPQFWARKVYRIITVDRPNDLKHYGLVTTIPNTEDTTFTDRNRTSAATFTPSTAITPTENGAGNISPGAYRWAYTGVRADGFESGYKNMNSELTISGTSKQVSLSVPIADVPSAVKRKIYRKLPDLPGTMAKSFRYIGEIASNSSVTTFADNFSNAEIQTARQPPDDPVDMAANPPHADAETYATPGTTDGVVRFTWKPKEMQPERPRIVLSKATSAVNTITITGSTYYTRVQFDAAAETSSGIGVSESSDILIHDVFVTLAEEDAVYVNNYNGRRVTIRDCVSYGCRRQGFALNSANDTTFENCIVYWPGRSGFDIEPYAAVSKVQGLWLKGCRVFFPNNYAIASANWHKIQKYNVEDFLCITGSEGLGGLTGGGVTGTMTNITSYWGPWRLKGQNMILTDANLLSLELQASVLTGTGFAYTAGGHLVDNIRLLTSDFTDESEGSITERIYVITGPRAGEGTLPQIVALYDIGHQVLITTPTFPIASLT